jgi:hypothetical protein
MKICNDEVGKSNYGEVVKALRWSSGSVSSSYDGGAASLTSEVVCLSSKHGDEEQRRVSVRGGSKRVKIGHEGSFYRPTALEGGGVDHGRDGGV